MDKRALDDTYHEVNQRPCLFEKALLTRRCACEKAVRFWLAEREGIGCASASAHARCGELLGHMRHSARFALQLQEPDAPLPHAKALRLQTGALLGLQRALTSEATDLEHVGNVYGLLSEAVVRFGDLEKLPFGEILRDVASFQVRPRRQ